MINQISTQLGVLTVSQRLAIALCGAMVVTSLLWLTKWSTTPDLVPVANYEFSYDELDAADDALSGSGIAYEIQGSRVLVRAGDRHMALRVMHSGNALPQGSLFDMETVVTDQNPFLSPEARKYAQTYAKGNELAKIIATYPFVKKASVLLNPTTRRRIGGSSDVPTASVAVTLRPGVEMSNDIVAGFASLVSGAVAGLKSHNVNIMDARSGRSFNVPSPGDAASFDYLGVVKKRESHMLAKIMNKLVYIPGVHATVSIELDTTKRVTEKRTYDPPQPRIETSQATDSGSADRSAEPGVQANTGTAIASGGAAQNSSTEESSTENFEPKLRGAETIEQLPFSTKRVTATVSIPRSFIVSIYQARFPDKEAPADTDPDFVAAREEETSRVKRSVERIVMSKSSNDVEVDVYPDMEWTAEGGSWSRAPLGVAEGAAQADAFDAVSMFRTYGAPAGLSVLALVSLMMMTRIARRSGQSTRGAAKIETFDEPSESTGVLTVGPGTVGQAEASEGFLSGKEVDEETLRYQELGAEVSRLAEGDPQGTAELIRRWMNEAD